MSRTRNAGWHGVGIALGCLVLGAPGVGAECKVGTPTNISGPVIEARAGAPVGQSFVACQDGRVTNVVVFVSTSTQASVVLGMGPGTDLLAPTYTEAGTIPTGSRIRFNPGFPVTAGETYFLSLAPASGSLFLPQHPAASYPGGSLFAVEGGASVAHPNDLEFSVTITEPAVPSPAATWGAIKSTYR